MLDFKTKLTFECYIQLEINYNFELFANYNLLTFYRLHFNVKFNAFSC